MFSDADPGLGWRERAPAMVSRNFLKQKALLKCTWRLYQKDSYKYLYEKDSYQYVGITLKRDFQKWNIKFSMEGENIDCHVHVKFVCEAMDIFAGGGVPLVHPVWIHTMLPVVTVRNEVAAR